MKRVEFSETGMFIPNFEYVNAKGVSNTEPNHGKSRDKEVRELMC